MATVAPSTDFGYNSAAVPLAAYPLTGNEVINADTQLTQGQNPNMELISTAQMAGYFRPPVVLADATTIATDASLARLFQVTLTVNSTLANPTNLQSGQFINWELTQDATGARTMAYGTLFKFVGGTNTLTTTAAAIDQISCVYDGTVLLCSLSAKYT